MPNLEKKSLPSDKEMREFWEWCGFKRANKRAFHYEWGKRVADWLYPADPPYTKRDLPELDLNNLFKYAVPKLSDAWALRITKYVGSPLFHIELTYCTLKYDEIKREDKDPALALFWAIWEVIKGK